jgi:hypothetical protein
VTNAWTDDALGVALADLGAHLRVPEHPLWTRVRADLDASDTLGAPVGGRAPWSRRTRGVVVVAVVLVVLLASTLSVAPARRAVADFLGIGSTSITHDGDARSRDLPNARDDVPSRADTRALRGALARADLFVLAPDVVGPPLAWRVDPDAETVVVYGDVVLGQRREGEVPALKRVPPKGRVDSTTVGARPAYWIEGPHTRELGGREYRSESALLWVVDGVELRLEGNLPLASMRRLAESVERA